MSVQKLLLNTLENLDQKDFDTLKFYLKTEVLEGYGAIARSHLEDDRRTNAVMVMIKTYGEAAAVDVTMEILRLMRNNQAAEKLQSQYQAMGGTTGRPPSAPPVTPSALPVTPGAVPVAPVTMSSQQDSVMIAPVINGSSVGPITINFGK